MTRQEQVNLIALLEHRFGDGSLYLRNDTDRQLLKRAVGLGLVSIEGYLTMAGKRFVQTGQIDETSLPSENGRTNYEPPGVDGL